MAVGSGRGLYTAGEAQCPTGSEFIVCSLPLQRKGSGGIDTDSVGGVTANKQKSSTPRLAPPAWRSRPSPAQGPPLRPSTALADQSSPPLPTWGPSTPFHVRCGLGAGWPCGAVGCWWLCLGVVLRGPPCPPAGPGGLVGALALALCGPTAPPWPPRDSGATCGHLRVWEPALAGAFLSGASSAPCSVCSGCVLFLLSAPLPLSFSRSLSFSVSLCLFALAPAVTRHPVVAPGAHSVRASLRLCCRAAARLTSAAAPSTCCSPRPAAIYRQPVRQALAVPHTLARDPGTPPREPDTGGCCWPAVLAPGRTLAVPFFWSPLRPLGPRQRSSASWAALRLSGLPPLVRLLG